VATSVYFNNFQSSMEQRLLEDLIAESIRIYGHDIFYVPRRLGDKDEIYGEDDISYFDRAYFVEMYINSVDGFTGDGQFFSRFGLEIRNQVTFTVAQRIFSQEVASLEDNMPRPREGDLIFFPLNDKCFQIKFVTDKPYFYQLGALQTYEMTCELFEYSNERFMTGNPDIDKLQKEYSINILDYAIKTEDDEHLFDEDGNYLVTEKYDLERIDPNNDNQFIQQESDDILDWSQQDPFSQSGRF
jgi:hypothetical protein